MALEQLRVLTEHPPVGLSNEFPLVVESGDGVADGDGISPGQVCDEQVVVPPCLLETAGMSE